MTIEERRAYRVELLQELYNTYFNQTPREIRIEDFNQLLRSDSERALAYVFLADIGLIQKKNFGGSIVDITITSSGIRAIESGMKEI